MLRFVLVVVVVAAIIGAGGFFVLSQGAIGEAQRSAEEIARIQGLGVVQPLLTDRVLAGDPDAISQLDGVVRTRVLDARTVRVKIWDASGRIVYSDEPVLIGQTFALGSNEVDALTSNRVDSYVSDLSRPENRFERKFGKLLEVYLPLQGQSGSELLFETYQEFASVEAEQTRLMLEFGPLLAGGLFLLLILEAPLAWSMARRLEAAALERERLLRRSIDASDGERRRIASDLHDGVVQRLAGTGMSLSAAASKLERPGHEIEPLVARAVRSAASEVREAVGELRTLIVKIAPTGLTAATLPAALKDLMQPLRAAGVETELRFGDCELDPAEVMLVFRVTQEALRNVARHSGAKHVTVEVSALPDCRVLVVTDDGSGFDPQTVASGRDGHLGLSLLRDMARDSGAELAVESSIGHGCSVELRLP